MGTLYHDLGNHVSQMIQAVIQNDAESANRAASIAQQLAIRTHKDKSFTAVQYSLVLKDFLGIIDADICNAKRIYGISLHMLREIFGDDHIIMADIYETFSKARSRNNDYEDALEFAGRCLLVRVNLLGILHQKTASSHVEVGVCYSALGQIESAKREFLLSRGIRCKLFGELSVGVAECDSLIALVEKMLNRPVAAYVAYYRSFRARHILLGPRDPLTVAAEQLVKENRSVNGERLISSLELKERTYQLQWNLAPTQSLQYSVYLFISRLGMDEALRVSQVKPLVSSAVNFSISRLASTVVKTLDTNDAPHQIQEESSIEQKQNIDALTTLLLISTKPSVLPTPPSSPLTSPLGSSKKPMNDFSLSQPTTPTMLPPPTRFPSQQSRTIEEQSSLWSVQLGEQSRDSPLQSPQPSPTGKKVTLPTQLSLSTVLEHPGEDYEDNSSAKSTVNPGSVESKSQFAAKSQQLSERDAANLSDSHTPDDSSKSGEGGSYRPKGARVVSPAIFPLDSPQRYAASWSRTQGKNIPYNLPLSMNSLTNKSKGESSLVYGRDLSGNLVLVRKASGTELRETVRLKLLLVGLFPWLIKNSLKVKSRNASIRRASRKASMKETNNGSPAPSAKANLMAFLGNRVNPLSVGAPPPVSAKSNTGPNWAKDPPQPPPLPTTWPPKSYPDSGAESTDGERSVKGKLGEAALGAGSKSKAPAGPKMKQIYLEKLPSIEGTLWADASDQLIEPSVLFDDLEEEFIANKPKPKPKLSQTAALIPGSAKSPTKGPGAKSQEKTVLDPGKAQNMNIMLAKFGKRNLFDIAQSICSFEAEKIGATFISTLIPFPVVPDETQQVNAFIKKTLAEKAKEAETNGESTVPAAVLAAAQGKSPVNANTLLQLKLGKAEQYVFIFSQVPQLSQRLSAMSVILSAQETANSIRSSSSEILNAVTEVKGSAKLKFLFKAFLDLSNSLMSKGKNSEPLTGFRLASLQKLSQTKANSGETVEQYVVRKVLAHFPEALEVSQDMPSIDAARKVIFTRLGMDLKKLQTACDSMKILLENNKTPETEGLVCNTDTMARSETNLKKYLSIIEKLFSQASQELTHAQGDFKELCVYLGESDENSAEDKKGPPPDPEFIFGSISRFIQSISKASEVAITAAKRKARLNKNN